MCTADRNTDVGSCSTHGPADEEHRDSSDQRYVADKRLQDHTQLPVQLPKTKSCNDAVTVMFCHLWWFPPLPGLLSLRLCRSTFWFPHLFPHPPRSCKQKEGGLLTKAEPRCEQRTGLFPALGKQRASNRDKSKLLQQYGNDRNILQCLTWLTGSLHNVK